MIQVEILIDAEAEGKFSDAHVDEQEIRAAVEAACAVGHCRDGSVGLRVALDPAIHEVNRSFLQHDYPTDVISFPYELAPPSVEGELVVSIETAEAEAIGAGWSVKEELLLYVIHGTLHLVGFDDTADKVRQQMRRAEQTALAIIGIHQPQDSI